MKKALLALLVLSSLVLPTIIANADVPVQPGIFIGPEPE